MSFLQLWQGGGTRRKQRLTRAELEEQLTGARKQAGKVKDAVLNHCPARAHGDFWVHTNVPQPCPWCEIVRLREQIQMLVTRPTPRPDAVAVDWATGMLRPANEPATDVTAETQPVDVRDLRAAMGEDDTVTLAAVTPVTPVVALDDTQMLVTWGTELPAKTKTDLEDWATGTAPGPMHEVPVGLGAKASIQVATHLDEAS